MTEYRGRLIAARERLGLTPREIAERILTPRQTYEQWESGMRRTPGVAVFAVESIPNRKKPRTDAILAAVAPRRTNADIARIVGATQDTVRSVLRRAKMRAAPAPMGANSHK
jgi:DNA-binding XRE family transcriptional regulator